MTITVAVEILNRERHRDRADWCVGGGGPDAIVMSGERYDWLEPFEAIAVAEKYERERPDPRRDGLTPGHLLAIVMSDHGIPG